MASVRAGLCASRSRTDESNRAGGSCIVHALMPTPLHLMSVQQLSDFGRGAMDQPGLPLRRS